MVDGFDPRSDRMKSNSNSSNICLNKHIIIIIYIGRKLWRREVFRFVANRKSVTYFFSTSRLEFESEIRQNIYLSSLSLERNNYHICTILLMVWRANNIHIYASSSSSSFSSSSTLSLFLLFSAAMNNNNYNKKKGKSMWWWCCWFLFSYSYS